MLEIKLGKSKNICIQEKKTDKNYETGQRGQIEILNRKKNEPPVVSRYNLGIISFHLSILGGSAPVLSVQLHVSCKSYRHKVTFSDHPAQGRALQTADNDRCSVPAGPTGFPTSQFSYSICKKR